METTTTGGAEAAPSEVIIHAPRADQLVQLAKSERVAAAASAAVPAAGGPAAR